MEGRRPRGLGDAGLAMRLAAAAIGLFGLAFLFGGIHPTGELSGDSMLGLMTLVGAVVLFVLGTVVSAARRDGGGR